MYLNPHTNEYFDVENLALRYYCLHEKLNGMHCENALGKTFFGLLMWDVVFDDRIPYVFQSPYQSHPLDFGTKYFYLSRKSSADARLNQISNFTPEQLQNEIAESWQKNVNKFNTLVNWNSMRLNVHRLKEIAGILGGKRLSLLVKNYTVDYKFWHHGMPDLILWDSKTGRVKFSEVKSENDKLSNVQKEWLAYMSQCGIHCEICLVNWKQETREEGVEAIEVFPEP
jgi:Fanconi-associated nuclease 1